MNRKLKRAVLDKTRLYNRYKRYPNSRNWELYRLQRNLVTKTRKSAIRDYFKTKCSEGVKNPNFWKTVKPFLTNKGTMQSDTIMIKSGNKILTDPKAVAQEMNNFYVNIASEIGGNVDLEQEPTESNSEFVQRCSNHFEHHPSIVSIGQKMNKCDFNFHPTDQDTVLKIIKNIDTSKATGFDMIPSKLLKPAAPLISYHLRDIFNQCISSNIFPDGAKPADVVPLFKKGDNLTIKNYRPVSILPSMSKILERIIHEQLKTFLQEVLDHRISAYRAGYSCQYALLRLIEDWKLALEQKKHVGSVLMDLSKAFDCLAHPLIIAKLRAYGLSIDGCAFLWSYLNDRKQRVKLAGTFSDTRRIIKGVPQGSVLGPIVFNLFINDLYATLENSILTNYADDNTITAVQDTKAKLLQTLTSESDAAISWFINNMMEANPTKFQAIALKNKEDLTISIAGSPINTDKHVTLLGVTLDKDLNFNEHIKTLCRKAAAQIAVLQRLSSYLDFNSRMAIFRCFILSHFSYCNLVWHFCGATNTSKLERLQFRALKFVFQDWDSNYTELLKKAKLPTLELARNRAILIEVFKSVNHLSPSFMWDLFEVRTTRYNLRNNNQLCVGHSRTVRQGQLSLRVYGAKLWNSLPDDFKNCDFKTFKHKVSSWTPPTCKCSSCRS